MDYIEPACCFDSSVYRGIPDAEPCRDPIDVPGGIRELDGLYNAGREKEALSLLEGIEGIGFVRMEKKDIVRHKLVTRIVNAYERADRENKATSTQEKTI